METGYGNSLQKTGPMESDYVLLRAEILATFFSMESKHFTDIDVQNDVIHPETLSYRMKNSDVVVRRFTKSETGFLQKMCLRVRDDDLAVHCIDVVSSVAYCP